MPDIKIDPLTGAPIVEKPVTKEEVHVDSQTTGTTNTGGTDKTDSSDGKESKEVVSIPPVLTHPPVKPTVAPAPPKPPVAAKATPKVKTEKDKCLDEMTQILQEEGQGMESNIGMTSKYWELQRKYRSL
jgi:hypothetical protein